MRDSITALHTALHDANKTLINAMTKVVMEFGEDFENNNDYYRNEFGIDEEEWEEDTKVLKIIDMFNNGGCCFPYMVMHHATILSDDKKSIIDWWACAFWGLYVVEKNKKLYLKYYLLCNEGREYDSDVSEPDHDYACNLSLLELEKLSQYLFTYVSQRNPICEIGDYAKNLEKSFAKQNKLRTLNSKNIALIPLEQIALFFRKLF